MKYETVIGLKYGARQQKPRYFALHYAPGRNTHCCPVCLGMPKSCRY